jgi:hypothetical protein
MNHFGNAYVQDQVIRWGVGEGIIPSEENDPSDAALVAISDTLAIRPSMANDVKIVRAGMTYMAVLSGYTAGHGAWNSYALLWANFAQDITKGNADLGEPPYSPSAPPPANSAPGSFPSSIGAAAASDAGPEFSARDVVCLPAGAPESLPLQPWRLTIESVLDNAPEGTDKSALEKDLLEQWLVVQGETRQGWEAVRYLARKRSPEEMAKRQKAHAAKAASSPSLPGTT